MKNLLIIIIAVVALFLTVQGMAQDSTQWIEDKDGITTTNRVSLVEYESHVYMTTDSALYIASERVITLGDLERYEIECYNDSSKVLAHECPDNMHGCLVYHTWYKTVHKEPTFEGFYKWLKENKIRE